jgi:hypothetical protein
MKKSVRFFLILPFFIFCYQNKTIAQCWKNGDLISYDQSAWGDPSTAAASNLNVNFDNVYASTLGVVEVGISGSSGFSMRFSSPTSVINYLPSVGTPAALNADVLDPTTTASGQFGGDVLALKLNVDFSDAGFLNGNVNTKFGDLVLYNFNNLPALNGLTIRQFLVVVDTLLGGGSTNYILTLLNEQASYSISDLAPITVDINNAFSAGTVSTFAQQHLKKGWKNGDVISYPQSDWGAEPLSFTGAASLVANYNSVYGSAGLFEIGIPGTAGFSMLFTSATDLLNYLPQGNSTVGPLTSDLLSPTSSPSGTFGGEVAGLKLNVDFSDAGLLVGNSGLHFGDLVLYGFGSLPDLNGMTVRQFLAIIQTLLGGGSATYSITDLWLIAAEINSSFYSSNPPTTFAQLHLKRGWQNGDLATYPQSAWGNGGVAANILINNYPSVYAPSYLFQIGLVNPGFSATWSDPTILNTFLPAGGAAAALDANIFDATSSVAGIFAGNVAAVKLNIDFSDAGFLHGNSGLKFGDLTICGLTYNTDLNGKTVRQFLDILNTALGGGTTTDNITDLNFIAAHLNPSFSGGNYVDTFSQLHLVNGSCDCGNTVTNHCPTASAINVSTTVGSAVKFLLQGSDADNNTLTYSISQNPLHGTATIAGGDSIIYTPTAAYHGTDQLKYTVSDGSCSAEATVNITVIVCPGGQGYWKNNKAGWPVTTLMLGTISYTQLQLMKILNTAVGTGNNADASLILADQLIAAKLSVANGSPAVQHVTDSIAAADALIGGNLIPMKVKPNTALGKKMISLATFFANYNNGVFTQGCSAPANITGEQLIADNELIAGNEIAQIPGGFVLEQNHPNPFHGSTIISYGLPANGNSTYHVSLKIYDITGREIRTLVNDEEKAGWKTINFDAGNVAAGIYLYRFSAGKFTVSGKMILIK